MDMKRLVSDKKKSKQIKDEWLGKPIEIINPESKLFSFRGVVDKLKEGKYTLVLDPEPYENTDKKHRIYVVDNQMFRWVRELPKE